jgi:hypothetical protein
MGMGDPNSKGIATGTQSMRSEPATLLDRLVDPASGRHTLLGIAVALLLSGLLTAAVALPVIYFFE